ncbi:hypothetical protein [Dechloromonas denitrificans]|uniref:hypothetical protein n=1 Tax=Dechloromonas denitrificans TaxID=281362 RepID=UPI001CF84AC4|nr:hypothetical protein [Dechloromonas denitrificans]UCV02296.1 hypothetical protein KI611_14515 [Dechloromonas denitrificans]
MTTPQLLATLNSLFAIGCAMLILWRTEPAINRMSKATHWMIRYALLLMAAGALAIILTTLAGDPPDPIVTLLAAGIALMLLCDRRLRLLLPHHKPGERRHA